VKENRENIEEGKKVQLSNNRHLVDGVLVGAGFT
jgi:hypothetical protein